MVQRPSMPTVRPMNPVLSPRQAAAILEPAVRKPIEPASELAELRNLIALHREPVEIKMTITQAMAIAMLALGDKNRRTSKAWINQLVVMMEEGRFELTHQGIAFDIHGRLRDGQHRLAAIVRYGKPVEMFVAFALPPNAFDAIDQGVKRSTSSMLFIDDVARPSVVSATVAMICRLEGKRAMDQQAILKYARQLLKRDDNLVRAAEAGAVVKGYGQVAAFALAHYQILLHSKHTNRLKRFWEQMVLGTGLETTDPVYVLRRQFAAPEKMIARAEAHIGVTQYALQVAFTAAIILAWNATIDGRVAKNFLWRDLSTLPEVK